MISSILKMNHNIDNIKDKKLLTKGYKAGFRLNSCNSIKETIQIYLKNTDEYDGIPLDSALIKNLIY